MSDTLQAHPPVDPTLLAKSGPFGHAMLEIGERRPDVVALSADVAGVTGLHPFAQAFPDRFVNVGMAEEDLISVAVGLWKAGFTPVATTFAVFATRRALDFIAIQCALNRANVKIVAALPGIYSTFGPTHQGIDDLAHMRALPNMTVIDPCDNAEMAEAVHAAIDLDGPVYLRELLGRETPDVDRGGHVFRLGEGQILREGTDVGIVTSGVMVHRSMDAAADACRARGLGRGPQDVDDQAVRRCIGARPGARDRRVGDGGEPLDHRRIVLLRVRSARPRRGRRARAAGWGPG